MNGEAIKQGAEVSLSSTILRLRVLQRTNGALEDKRRISVACMYPISKLCSFSLFSSVSTLINNEKLFFRRSPLVPLNNFFHRSPAVLVNLANEGSSRNITRVKSS